MQTCLPEALTLYRVGLSLALSASGLLASMAHKISGAVAMAFIRLFAFSFIWLMNVGLVVAQEKVEPFFIEDFLKEESNYPTMTDRELSVEGRLSFVGKETIRFLKSELEFHIPRDTVPPQKSGRLEVTGELKRQGGKVYFDVRRMRGLPSESESIEVRLRVPNLKVQDYYDLADWAQKRADFYNDVDLAAKANDVRLLGLNLARRGLAPKDGLALLDVAAVAAQQGLPEEIVHPINHEGLRLAFEHRDKKTFVLEPFLKLIGEKLPGALTPAGASNLLLVNQYRVNPLPIYASAPEASRRLLERVFYQEVVETALKGQLLEDGRNGNDLAEKMNQLLPEAPELASPFRARYLEFRVGALSTATRQQALELSATFRKQGDEKTADEVIITWLDYRKGRVNVDNVADVMALADDYLTLAKNTAKASELLDAANRKHPNVAEIELRLARLGFVEVEGKWLTPGQFAALPKDPILEAMRQGVVSEGMTREQVYKTLGKPSSTTRALSASGFAEAWTYEGAKLTIRFSTRVGAESKVAEIVNRR